MTCKEKWDLLHVLIENMSRNDNYFLHVHRHDNVIKEFNECYTDWTIIGLQ